MLFMTDLKKSHCKPCEDKSAHLMANEMSDLLKQVPKWELREWHHLYRKFEFKNFKEALEFVNKVGAIAEDEGHHPDICFGWGKVEITLFTHSVDGLSENDFILAPKIDELVSS